MGSDRDLHVVREPSVPGDGAPVGCSGQTDAQLLAASAAGHRDAFEVLVARYLPRLTSYCAKLTRDTSAAEDLAQDTLLALWHRRASYRPDREVHLLVFTIALNRCRNHARSWRRRLRWLGVLGEPEEIDAVPVREPIHVDRLLELERQRRALAALAALPHHARAVLLLRFEQELSYAHIAEIVGKREVTVRSQVFHALRKLQRVLEQDSP